MLRELHELTALCVFEKPVSEPDFDCVVSPTPQPEQRSGRWVPGVDVPDEWKTELHRRIVEDR
ncbi:MAG: hypothetical protein ACYCW6_06280 [Candidatus Xenobia bacterium]